MKTMTVQLDDATWDRLCELQRAWGVPTHELLTALINRLSRPEVLAEQIIGSMRDESDLEARVLAEVMNSRGGPWDPPGRRRGE